MKLFNKQQLVHIEYMQLFAINQLDKQRLNGKHTEALMVDDSLLYHGIVQLRVFRFVIELSVCERLCRSAIAVVVELIMKIVFAKLNDRQCADYGMAMVK
ncbi:hypothetical protein T08_11557 [Trichinella sp. T8]|nr:hypothetical protein T08_11557 [Trichinella sp. T8]